MCPKPIRHKTTTEIEDTGNPLEGWRRSKKGNLYRKFPEGTLTVFRKSIGWGICLYDGEAQFSPGWYGTAELAAEAAMDWFIDYLDEFEEVDEVICEYEG